MSSDQSSVWKRPLWKSPRGFCQEGSAVDQVRRAVVRGLGTGDKVETFRRQHQQILLREVRDTEWNVGDDF